MNNMLEQLFIYQEDTKFHMKVEADSEPISQLLRRKKQEDEEFSNLDASRMKNKKVYLEN